MNILKLNFIFILFFKEINQNLLYVLPYHYLFGICQSIELNI